MSPEEFCCKMRERFLIGVVAENRALPVPTDVADFVDWDAKAPDGKVVLTIKYCPFCGKRLTGPARIL